MTYGIKINISQLFCRFYRTVRIILCPEPSGQHSYVNLRNRPAVAVGLTYDSAAFPWKQRGILIIFTRDEFCPGFVRRPPGFVSDPVNAARTSQFDRLSVYLRLAGFMRSENLAVWIRAPDGFKYPRPGKRLCIAAASLSAVHPPFDKTVGTPVRMIISVFVDRISVLILQLISVRVFFYRRADFFDLILI